MSDEEGVVVATGTSVQVIDYHRKEKVRVPEAVRSAIAAMQGA